MSAVLSDEALMELGVGGAHHFAGEVYCKESRLPAGSAIGKHVHDFDHLACLVSGSAEVFVDGTVTVYEGYRMLLIEGGKYHEVRAVTDVIWLCLHNERVALL